MTEAEYSEIVEEIRNDYSKLSEAALIDYSRRWDECRAILHEMKHVLVYCL